MSVHYSLDLDFVSGISAFLGLALSSSGSIFLSEIGIVPETEGLIKGAGNDEILVGVELCAHDVVAVPCEDG